MTTQLTTAGLEVDSFEETLDSIESEQKADISPSLDLSTSSPLGQLNRIMARAVRLVNEALEAVYAGIDPDSNTGDAQDRIAAITGTYREAAKKAEVTLSCNLDAGTYAVGSLVAHTTGRPQDRFVNAAEVTTAGGDELVAFEGETAGVLQAPSGAAGLYVIAGPVSGWNSIGASSLANAGTDAETDAALRIRRNLEIQSPGSTSPEGIAADISANITDVISVRVIENDQDVTVDGIPPHSLEAVVFGPVSPTTEDNETVATQIYQSKAGGIGTHGNISVTIVDNQGVGHLIKFSRPSDVTVPVTVTIEVDASLYQGDNEVSSTIDARIEELVPGYDVTWADVAAWTMEVPGVIRVTALLINGVSLTDFVINNDEKARAGTITVNSSTGTI